MVLMIDKSTEEEAYQDLLNRLMEYSKFSRGNQAMLADCVDETESEVEWQTGNLKPFGRWKADLKAEVQDELEEVNISGDDKIRPIFISKEIGKELREEMIGLIKEYSDCFAWSYHEMPGLDRRLVEHHLPIKPKYRPHKQPPRRMANEIVLKIKEEIERLLKAGFIRTARYVDWLANIVPVMKKNGKLRICIDFRDLNKATPKDEYPMPVADIFSLFGLGQ